MEFTVKLTSEQLIAIVAHLSSPITFDGTCPICSAKTYLLANKGFITEPACGPRCAVQVLRDAYTAKL